MEQIKTIFEIITCIVICFVLIYQVIKHRPKTKFQHLKYDVERLETDYKYLERKVEENEIEISKCKNALDSLHRRIKK